MGPRFVNVEYKPTVRCGGFARIVSMGPRFVNVEYPVSVAANKPLNPGFNGATFCERGIL